MAIKKHFIIYLVIIILAVYGYSTIDEQFFHWDEYYSCEVGRMNFNYVSNKNDSLQTFKDRDYGPLFETAVYSIQKIANYQKVSDIVTMRHKAVFLVFLIGLLFFYFLLIELKFSILNSITGVLLIVFSPRISGQAFFNSKDIVLMVFLILAVWSLILLAKENNYKTILIHSLFSAFAITTRITAVLIIPVTILLMVWLNSNKSYLKSFFYLLLTSFFIVLFWPYLWEKPVGNILLAFSNMQNFRWNEPVLFMGEYFRADNPIWYYLPVWIFISTPESYLILVFVGLFITVKTFFKKSYNNVFFKRVLVGLYFGVFPLLYVIISKSVVYDSWRHLYFIYPFLLIFALIAIEKCEENILKKTTLYLFYIFIFASPVYIMVKNRPFFYLYFNSFVTNDSNLLIKQYEFDYWGVYYKQAIEKTLIDCKMDTIYLMFANGPGYDSFRLLKEKNLSKNAIETFDIDKCDYYISNLRFDYQNRQKMQLIKQDSLCWNNNAFVYIFKKLK